MSALAALMKKRNCEPATVTVATSATQESGGLRTVATVAGVAVAKPENRKTALGPRAPWAEFAENLVEHYQEIRQILEREVQLPAPAAHEQARAAAALLAFKLKMPWAALRAALGDQSLPNSDDPVDRIPYQLPHWLRLPNGQSDKA
jgi:hypothetical protein